jgi:hypothetical protein
MADTTVNLDVIAPGYTVPNDGTWKQCLGDNKQPNGFYYKFTGGNAENDDGSAKNDGSVVFQHDATGASPKTVLVQLVTADGYDPSKGPNSRGYRITDVPIAYDGSPANKDLSVTDDSNPRQWEITDSNKDAEQGEIEVVVSWTASETSPVVPRIHCDPGWRNK